MKYMGVPAECALLGFFAGLIDHKGKRRGCLRWNVCTALGWDGKFVSAALQRLKRWGTLKCTDGYWELTDAGVAKVKELGDE